MTPEELRSRRQQLGFTQGQLAERLGVAENTIYRWETGRLPIDRPEMLQLALDQLLTEHAVAVRDQLQEKSSMWTRVGSGDPYPTGTVQAAPADVSVNDVRLAGGMAIHLHEIRPTPDGVPIDITQGIVVQGIDQGAKLRVKPSEEVQVTIRHGGTNYYAAGARVRKVEPRGEGDQGVSAELPIDQARALAGLLWGQGWRRAIGIKSVSIGRPSALGLPGVPEILVGPIENGGAVRLAIRYAGSPAEMAAAARATRLQPSAVHPPIKVGRVDGDERTFDGRIEMHNALPDGRAELSIVLENRNAAPLPAETAAWLLGQLTTIQGLGGLTEGEQFVLDALTSTFYWHKTSRPIAGSIFPAFEGTDVIVRFSGWGSHAPVRMTGQKWYMINEEADRRSDELAQTKP